MSRWRMNSTILVAAVGLLLRAGVVQAQSVLFVDDIATGAKDGSNSRAASTHSRDAFAAGDSVDMDAIGNAASQAARGGTTQVASGEHVWMEPPVPIRVGAKVHRIVVTDGADGGTVVSAGTVSGVAVSCEDNDNAVYCNTLGNTVFGPGGQVVGRIADDIVTTALAPIGDLNLPCCGQFCCSPSDETCCRHCDLDRFKIRVTGDKSQDPDCVGEEYSVTFALYATCPGANRDAIPIAGTEIEVLIPAAQACDIVDVERLIPSFSSIKLPNQLYLGVKFSRRGCAWVVGAPPTRGFSDDRFDFPGFPCDAALGGFPAAPHASFYVEIYVRDDCSESFAGYRNSSHAQLSINPGLNVRFADDITLGVPSCNLIAYEVAYKNNAILAVDLRTGLSTTDPERGDVIPGTAAFLLPHNLDVEIGRVEVDPPVSLPRSFFFGVKSATAGGPILTCRQADIGETSDLYFVYNGDEWVPVVGTSQCWGGLDITIYCEGSAPMGACCDMVLTDNRTCVGGPNQGNPCARNADCRVCVGGALEGQPCANRLDCPDGECPESWVCVGESVCRQLPEINCASTELAPTLWREGGICGPFCAGGILAGESCVQDADCLLCSGGARHSQPCCPDGTCDPDTDECVGGERDTLECCPEGTCPNAICAGSFCEGGSNNGQPCSRQADCPGANCAGGTLEGHTCTGDDDCPNSFCRAAECPGPFQNSCGLSVCCRPDPDEGRACENLTEKQCRLIPEVEDPRMYLRGSICAAFNCPIIACLTRSGECTLERQAFCAAGDERGNECDPIQNNCLGVCLDALGGTHGPCTFSCVSPWTCGRRLCVGGPNDGNACHQDLPATCPEGSCSTPICKGLPGCENPFCCSDVCLQPQMFDCCTIHWGPDCAITALSICENVLPSNDECFDSDPDKGARPVNMFDSVESDSIKATEGAFDPGFCCHEGLSCPDGSCSGGTCIGGDRNGEPCDPSLGAGSKGLRTVWYKFIAPGLSCPNGSCSDGTCSGGDRNGESCDTDSSVRVSTCCSVSRTAGLARDSLVQVFSVTEPDRGVCSDLTVCSVEEQACFDGSECVFDERIACSSLSTIGCNDDHGGFCNCGGHPDEPGRSTICVTDLVPGDPYYVLVAAKHDRTDSLGRPIALGFYRMIITPGCTQRPPVLHNDLCDSAEELSGGDTEQLLVPFDLSGAATAEAAATFDCPGPPSFCMQTLENDIWYDWTAPCDGEATIETCDGANTPDTGLVVYEGCGCPVEDGRIVACSDFRPGDCFLGSKVTIPVLAGNCYKFRLGGHLGGEPAGNLKVSVVCGCAVPTESVTFVEPEDGVVDARQPYPPTDPGQAQGIDMIVVEAPAGAEAGDGACWSICETDSTGTDNMVTGVTFNFIDLTWTLELLRPITPGAVTKIVYTDHIGTEYVAGVLWSHPGNVDGGPRADQMDIPEMISYLNGATPRFGLYSADIDHSGQLAPGDLLRLIDLHNGAADYAVNPWGNTDLPLCEPCCP